MEELLSYIDYIVIAALIALTMVYLFTIGKGRSASLLISSYIAVFTVRAVPDIFELSEQVDVLPADLQSMILIGLIIVVVQALLSRNSFFEPYVETERGESVAYGLASVGLYLYAMSYLILPSTLEYVDPAIQTAFFDEPFRYIWPLAPLAIILLVRGK